MAQMKRRAVFFSIISIFLILMLLAATKISVKSEIEESELAVTRTRVKILNSLISNMEDYYFERLLQVSVKNSVMSLSEHYAQDNFDNIEKPLKFAVEEVMQDGILKESTGNIQVMDRKYSVGGMTDQIEDIFSTMGVEVRRFNVTLIDFVHEDPWTIRATAEIEYYFADDMKIANWRGKTTKTAYISVIGFTLFDYESGVSSNNPGNIQVVTDSWVVDNGPYFTEPSAISKLSNGYTRIGMGLCSPDFRDGDYTCKNDTN